MHMSKEDLAACIFCMNYLYSTLDKSEGETQEFRGFTKKLVDYWGCNWFEFSDREIWWLMMSLGFVKYLVHTSDYDDLRGRLLEYGKLDSFEKEEVNTLLTRS